MYLDPRSDLLIRNSTKIETTLVVRINLTEQFRLFSYTVSEAELRSRIQILKFLNFNLNKKIIFLLFARIHQNEKSDPDPCNKVAPHNPSVRYLTVVPYCIVGLSEYIGPLGRYTGNKK